MFSPVPLAEEGDGSPPSFPEGQQVNLKFWGQMPPSRGSAASTHRGGLNTFYAEGGDSNTGSKWAMDYFRLSSVTEQHVFLLFTCHLLLSQMCPPEDLGPRGHLVDVTVAWYESDLVW